MRRNLPPRKVCAGCGGWFYGYAEACAGCRNEQAADSSALVDVLRERRLERRESLSEWVLRRREERPYQGEFPDGY